MNASPDMSPERPEALAGPESPEAPQELRPLEQENGRAEEEEEEDEEGTMLMEPDEDDEEEEEEEEDNGMLEDEVSEDLMCQICNDVFKQPRLLDCLHRFCTTCIEGLVEPEDNDVAADLTDPLQAFKAAAARQAGSPKNCFNVVCTICTQTTKLGPKGVEDLQPDYVLVNALDVCAIEKKQIVCTSCKAKEKAVARCQDCANFLCPNCVTAHQYMRCFENHKVESFEDMQKDGDGLSIHKPLFCPAHASESMKYYCTTCQAPICSECVASGHPPPEHIYQRIGDVEAAQRIELKQQVQESQAKAKECMDASESLEQMLTELQMARDNAKGMVEETFQTYKAMLDKKREDTMAELERLHKEQELNIMDGFHNVEKCMEKIEDGCKFADNVLKQGNAIELLLLKKTISTQLMSLINNSPKPEVNVKIEFDTDTEKFQKALDDSFGDFRKFDNKKDNQNGSLHSSFENETGLALPPTLFGSQNAATNLLTTPTDFILPPLSMPDMAGVMAGPGVVTMAGGNVVPGVSQQTINNIASSLQNLSSAAASTTGQDRSSSRSSYRGDIDCCSPAMSDSGISIGGEQANMPVSSSQYNVSSLSKLGTVGVNSKGQITLNGQALPGIDINNAVGLPPGLDVSTAVTQSRTTPTDLSDPTMLSNLLSNMNLPTSSASAFRPTTPQMPDMSNFNLFSPNTFTGSNPNLMGAAAAAAAANVTGNEFAPMVSGLTLGGNSAFKPAGQPPYPVRDSSKMTAMQIRCKFGQLGPGKGQFNSPHGFCLGIDDDIVTADTNNHRIQVFEKTGEYKYQFGIPGRDEGQLWYPRKVAVIRSSGRYVVCDRGNERSRMQLFTRAGHFIRKIAIRYIDIVAGLAITQEGYIAAVDSVSPTVFVIDPESSTGELVRWFDCSDYMREPSDIAIRGKEYYVCDFKGHCVVAFSEDGAYLRRIGCDTITNYPNGIDVSDAGDILVGDSHGNRFHVAVFSRQGELTGEFQCPYVKVSRCCGLKITPEGYVVTLAKNNHHVLVLGTLYLT